MIISIFASIWAQNLWDELILKNEIKLLEREYGKNTKFLVFSYDYKNPFFKKSNIEYKEYFPIWIKDYKNIFRNIFNFFTFLSCVIKSDLIVVWWWWIIYDNEKQLTKNPLDSWIFRTNIFRFFWKKIYFFAVWLNIKNKQNNIKVKKIFKNAYKITVRDFYSYNLLKYLDIKSDVVLDPVFNENKNVFLENYMIKKISSNDFTYKDLEDISFEWKKVALAFRKWYFSDDKKEEKIITEIINFLLSKNALVILLPHSFHKKDKLANDYLFLNKFLKINEKVRIVNSMEDIYSKYIYKEFDICLAMRLHSIILSQVYSIPFVRISYSKKTDEVLSIIQQKSK